MELKRTIFLSLGIIFLVVATIGIFLPVLPTTPFVLIAAFCFSKSSKRAEKWILKNRYFGTYIENYRNKCGVPIDIKINSIMFLWFMLIISIFLFSNNPIVSLFLIFIGLAVTIHIYTLKTQKPLIDKVKQ